MRLASRGQRDMDDGCVALDDPAQASAARERARTILWKSTAAAALGTLAYVIVSG